MKISVAALPEQCKLDRAQVCDSDTLAMVVIDVLRFTTTAAQALFHGAASIRVVQEIEEAKQLTPTVACETLLCGERLCQPIPGFDLGNSPLEYKQSVVNGRPLIFSTTNGTRAVQSTGLSDWCFLGSLVNRTAVGRALIQSKSSIGQIVCAGTDGQIAGEDLLAAGAIIDALRQMTEVELVNDSARISAELWRHHWSGSSEQLFPVLKGYLGGSNLIQAGYQTDVQFCCQVDHLDVVPARRADPDFVRLDNLFENLENRVT